MGPCWHVVLVNGRYAYGFPIRGDAPAVRPPAVQLIEAESGTNLLHRTQGSPTIPTKSQKRIELSLFSMRVCLFALPRRSLR